MSKQVTRRGFMAQSAVAATALFAGPSILRAASLNNKINYAFIATGGRGRAHLGLADNENCVAYCDTDKNAWKKVAGKHPKAEGFTDYRKMLDKHGKETDAVVVATPDHNHAVASMMALKMGKAVYCEKPLTWSIAEARALTEEAAKQKVPTQMGNHGHAFIGPRAVVEWIHAGAIGDVLEVHTWTNRPVWPQGIQKRPASKPVPENLDWDCWIGPAPFREYHDGLHGFKWRGWFDFGAGAIGDMGCHTWDNVNWAMQPDYPTAVELIKIEGKSDETFPTRSVFKWEFPANAKRPGFNAFWYSGGLKPSVPEELNEEPPKSVKGKDGKAKPGKKRSLPRSGSLYIGTKGKLLVGGDYAESPRLIPESAWKAFKRPESTIPKSPGHKQEWVMAIKGEKPWDFPKSNFGYAGPMTELMLLGNIAIRIGEVGYRIECDPAKRIVKTKKAADMVAREYRKGWTL